MPYPKPLSAKSIEKLFSTWDPHTVEVLHTYYEAFANVYGFISLYEAWELFCHMEKNQSAATEEQFLDFAEIVRREDVNYHIYEVDELFKGNPRQKEYRFIVNKKLLDTRRGSDKLGTARRFIQNRGRQQENCFCVGEEFWEAAKHRHADKELKAYIESLAFRGGEHDGMKFSEAVFLTLDERDHIRFTKNDSEKEKLRKAGQQLTFSEKFMKYAYRSLEYFDTMVGSLISYLYLNDYRFESSKKAEEFAAVVIEFINNSHLWVLGGMTPLDAGTYYCPLTQEHPEKLENCYIVDEIRFPCDDGFFVKPLYGIQGNYKLFYTLFDINNNPI